MAVTAKLRYLRIAPRKVRLVADMIRGKTAKEAQTILNFTTKKAAPPIFKLLKSAIASARNNLQLEESNLYISKITVDEGPKLKRWMPRSRGQAYRIQKKASHVTIILDEIKKTPKKARKVSAKVSAKEKEIEKEIVKERTAKQEKPKFEPKTEMLRPKASKGIKRIFRRKSF